MKRFIRNVALLVLVVSGAAAVGNAQSDSFLCNDQLIVGVYGFTIQGTKLAGKGPIGQQVGVAMTEFHGDGTLSQIDAVTVAGTQVASFDETPTLGTYKVKPDCTGTFTLNFTDGRPTVTTSFVVVDNGNEIDTVVTTVVAPTGAILTGAVAVGSIGKRRFTPFGEFQK